MRNKHASLLLAGVLAAVLPEAAWTQTQYMVTDLGPGSANGINDNGDIVGDSTALAGPTIWRFGIFPTRLPGSLSARATAVNSAGIVVGYEQDCDVLYASPCGVVWYPPYGDGSREYLKGVASYSGRYSPSEPWTISDSGLIGGRSAIYDYWTTWGYRRATVWDWDGVPYNLGVLPTTNESCVRGINRSGQVVGESGLLAFTGGIQPVAIADLSLLAYAPDAGLRFAADINNARQIVGHYAPIAYTTQSYRIDLNRQAFTQLAGGGFQGSWAYSINDASEVVGPGMYGGYTRAFVWNEWGGMAVLDQLIHPQDPLAGSVYLANAKGINGSGQIVAEGYLLAGGQISGGVRVFLLDPIGWNAAYLRTGSPVSISQLVSIADEPTELRFDYRFDSAMGLLTVRLDGDPIATLSATPMARFQTKMVVIGETHRGLIDVPLEFELDGPAGSAAALDNIMLPGLINGRFDDTEFFGWTIEAASGGSVEVVELIPPEELRATVEIAPEVITAKVKGPSITAYIELGEGGTAADIDLATVAITEINGTAVSIPAQPRPSKLGDKDKDGIPDLMVRFPREEVVSSAEPGETEIIVTGALKDGTVFRGGDDVLILP